MRPNKLHAAALAAALLFACSSVGREAAQPASAGSLLADGRAGDDWPAYGGTYSERHFSPLTDINDGNVGRLGLSWSFDLPLGNPVTVPVEVGGKLYVASGLSVVRAFDAATGRLLWTYDPRAGEHGGIEMRYGWGSRGIAWWNDKVYTATMDGRLIALDARTGRPLWTVQTTVKGSGQFISGAPRAFDGKIVIGQGGGDSTTSRGYATAYDAETGKQLWRFYTVPGDPGKGFENEAMAMAAKTWTGEWWKYGGGGQPWNAFTYDRETNTLLIGTGNGFPWNQKIRSPGGGDNLFLCSMVAVDATTGAYKWHYQFNPGETWDYNAAMDMALADLVLDGQKRKVVMTAPKNGFFYVIDRTNGKLISAEKIAKVTWADRIDIQSGRPIELPGTHFPNGQDFELWPSNTGAHSWMPMAYSPAAQLAFIPKIEDGVVFHDRGIDLKNWVPVPGTVGQALNREGLRPATSALLAWDPVKQKEAWKVDTVGGWNGGILSTGGNLVFQGQLDGQLRAYAAGSGKLLWQFLAQAAVLSAPITYRVKGRQFVTVVVGMGTSAAVDRRTHGGLAFDARSQKRRVLTFAIGGKAVLPKGDDAPAITSTADPDYRPDEKLAQSGAMLFGKCLACHGYGAAGAGAAPDLRISSIPLDAEAFRTVVHDGVMRSTGMPRYGELTDADLAALRQYLRAMRAELRASETAGKPH